MSTRLIAILAFTAVTVSFQSCGRTENSPDGVGAQYKDVPITTTAQFNKIVYDVGLEGNPTLNTTYGRRVEIDLSSGSVLVSKGDLQSTRTCTADLTRLAALQALIAAGEVCEPGELPPGTISCMAIGVADIQLTNGQESIQLRPLICNFGRYLCNGKDKELRRILSDLRDNPPTGCSSQP